MTRLPLLGMLALVSVALPMMAAHQVLATATRPVGLGAGPTRVQLTIPQGVELRAATQSNRKLFVVVRGLRAQKEPGVLYRMYLNVPAGAKPSAAHYVGMLNFFGSEGTGHAPRAFDVTSKRALLRERATITIVPRGRPERGAKPVIERIELIVE